MHLKQKNRRKINEKDYGICELLLLESQQSIHKNPGRNGKRQSIKTLCKEEVAEAGMVAHPVILAFQR